MADYNSNIVVNSFIISCNHIGVRCMKTHSKECKKFISNEKSLL